MTIEQRKAALEAFNKSDYPPYKYLLAEHFETIRAALSEKDPAPLGWRPIETAPRDGKRVLFYCDGDVREGYADNYGFYIINNGDYYDGGYGQDYQCDEKNKGKDYGYSMPTHWMPLPQPPTEQKLSEFKGDTDSGKVGGGG